MHIPYCVRKCPYCGFYSEGIGELSSQEASGVISDYVSRLIEEIGEGGDSLVNTAVDSIFIGGGTPSLLSVGDMKRLLDELGKAFCLERDCEITMEANPGTLRAESLKGYRELGVNRLSIGVQSFDDEVLKTLGRIHNSQEGEKAYFLAREAGFENINLDLMFGVPGQTLNKWECSFSRWGPSSWPLISE